MPRKWCAVFGDCLGAFHVTFICVTVGILGFLLLLIGGNWYLWRNAYYTIGYNKMQGNGRVVHLFKRDHPHPPVQERCTSEYPAYSVPLDYPVSLPDGRFQVQDGAEYPLSATWESGGVIRGCPCTLNPCVHSCCREDQVMVEGSYSVKCADTKMNVNISHTNKPKQPAKSHYYILYSDCNYAYKSTEGKLTEDGRIWYNSSRTYFDGRNECFDVHNGKFNVNTIYTCPYPRIMHITPESIERGRRNLEYSFILGSLGLHVITLVVFFLVPKMRTGYGTILMAYLVGQLVRKLAMVFRLYTSSIKRYGVIEYYGDVFYHVCQIAIAYHLWAGFKPGRLRNEDRGSSFNLIVFSALISAVPTVWLMGRENYGEEMSPLYQYDPVHFAFNTYAFYGQVEQMAPLLVAELVCMVLCAAALYRIRSSMKTFKKLKRSESQHHNAKDVQWSAIFLKLTLITGVDYTLVTVLTIIQKMLIVKSLLFIPFYIIYILRDINNLRGSEIFFIFVLKPEVWKAIQDRFFSK